MNKIKTIIKHILKIDYKNMFKITKKVSKKAKKPFLVIFIDMIYSGIKYGAGYYDYQEFDFYLLNKKERKTYLTRLKNLQIIKKFNKKEGSDLLNDKVRFNEKFKTYINRDFLMIDGNYEEFIKFTNKHKVFMAKPISGDGGFGIEKIEIKTKTNIKKLYDKLIDNNQLLLEEYIIQHESLNKLYEKSVNTLRLFTFYDGDKSYVVNSVFKIGAGSVVDNFASGGMYTFLNEDGKVIVPAIDKDDNEHTYHPISKKEIVGYKIPLYKEACELVKKASKEIDDVRYIGWDVAISKDGPVIVEGNPFPGVFQIKPSFGLKKEGLIPKYEKVMKITLE